MTETVHQSQPKRTGLAIAILALIATFALRAWQLWGNERNELPEIKVD